MSNYRDIGLVPAPLVAGADLTSRQYRMVAAGSVRNEVILATGASNPFALGALQNSPSSGDAAEVVMLGFAKAAVRVSTCNLVYGRYLVTASDGFLEVAATAGSPVCARYHGQTISTAGASANQEVFLFGITACGVAAS